MADRPVRYIIEGDASKLKGEFKELAADAKALAGSIKGIKDALAAVRSGETSSSSRRKKTDAEKEQLRATKSQIDALRRSLSLSEELRRQNERGAAQRERDLRKIGKITEDVGQKQRQVDEAWAKRSSARTAEIERQRRALERLADASRKTPPLTLSERDRRAAAQFPFERPPSPRGRSTLNQLQARSDARVQSDIAKAQAQRSAQIKAGLEKQRQIEAAYADLRKGDMARVAAETRAAWKKRESDYAAHIKSLEALAKQERSARRADEAAGEREFGFQKPPKPTGRRTLRQVEKSLERQAQLADKIRKNTDGATRAFDRFGKRSNGVLANTARRIKDVVSALIIFDTLRALRDGIRNTFSFIIEANQKVEDARIGIASTLTVAGEFVDQFGKALPIAEQIRISLAEADALIPKLLEVSSGSGISFDALLQTQTATAGFTRAAGFSPEQTVELLANVTFFSEKLGISQSRIVKTLDNIIKGYRVQQTELGTALGLDSERIKQLREEGKLIEKFNEIFQGTTAARRENLKTLGGLKNALDAQLQILSRRIGVDLFQGLKSSYEIIRDSVDELSRSPEQLENIRGLFKKIGEGIVGTTETLASFARTISEINWASGIEEVEDVLSKSIAPGTIGFVLLRMFGFSNPAALAAFIGVTAVNALDETAPTGGRSSGSRSSPNRPRGVGADLFDDLFGGSSGRRFGSRRGNGSRSRNPLADEPGMLARPSFFSEEDAALIGQRQLDLLDDPFSALDFSVIPPEFRGRAVPEDEKKKSRSGSRVRERTLEQAVNERIAEFNDSIKRQLEELERLDERRLAVADSRLSIAQSELAIIEASERPLAEQIAAQQGIFDLKLAQLDLEKQLTAERIRAIQTELDLGAGELELDLKSEIFELEKRLNDLATERIVLTNENTAAIERQIRAQSDSATILGDIIKGLRDGVSFDDLLGDIGRRSADKFIDSFLTEKLNVLDPAIEGNFLDVIPKALTQGGKDGISGLGRLFSGASGEAFKTPSGTFGNIPGGSGNTGGGGGGAGAAAAGSGFAGIGSLIGAGVSGLSLGAGLGSFSGAFGANKNEQKAAIFGGAAGGAVGGVAGGLTLGAAFGSFAGPVGAISGAIVGLAAGLIAEALGAFKGPKSDKVIRGIAREAIKDAGLPSNLGKRAGALPVDSASLPAIARFLSLNEIGQERKLGRGAFDVQSAQQDVALLLGTPLLGLSQRDRDAAISRVLQSASGGLDAGLDRLTVRRTERLANIQDRANRARSTSTAFATIGGVIERGSIKVGNERIPLDTAGIEDYVATQTAAANANFRTEVASLIDGIDDIPAAIDGATLALSVIGTDGVAHIERLKDMIEDTASILETGFTGAIQNIAEGSSLRDAIAALEEAYSDTLTERFTSRFLEESIASPKFTEAVAKGNEAIDAFLAGDPETARQILRESKILANEANLDSAEFLAGASPFLRELNQNFGGQGIVAPLGGASNEVVDLLSQINENLAQGRSVSVYAQTTNGTTISAREISDAERHAHQRQSSGQRRPDPTVGMRQ